MADYHFAKAGSWPELIAMHAQWVSDYNEQSHWAQRRSADRHDAPIETDPGTLATLVFDGRRLDEALRSGEVKELRRLVLETLGSGEGMRHLTAVEGRQTGGQSGALRAAVFGINDGLVSNFSLVMGVGALPRFQVRAAGRDGGGE